MNDEIIIGEIDFSEVLNESKTIRGKSELNFKGNKGVCKVMVKGNEGAFPHFHIVNKDNTFKCCVMIYSNHYFNHNDEWRDTLSSSECRILDKWLKDPNKENKKMSNWQAIVAAWEETNKDTKYDEEIERVKEKPHYENMKNFKRK